MGQGLNQPRGLTRLVTPPPASTRAIETNIARRGLARRRRGFCSSRHAGHASSSPRLEAGGPGQWPRAKPVSLLRRRSDPAATAPRPNRSNLEAPELGLDLDDAWRSRLLRRGRLDRVVPLVPVAPVPGFDMLPSLVLDPCVVTTASPSWGEGTPGSKNTMRNK